MLSDGTAGPEASKHPDTICLAGKGDVPGPPTPHPQLFLPPLLQHLWWRNGNFVLRLCHLTLLPVYISGCLILNACIRMFAGSCVHGEQVHSGLKILGYKPIVFLAEIWMRRLIFVGLQTTFEKGKASFSTALSLCSIYPVSS